MNVEVDAENPPTPGESAPSTPRSSNLQQPSAADTSAATSNPGSKGQTPCKFFFSKRGCAYGSECKFSHSPRAQPEKTARDEHVREGREASKPPVCRHYLSSAGCKYGDKCRYHHPAEEDSARGEGGTGASEDVEQTLSEDLQMRAHITPLGRGRHEGSRVDEFPHDVREDMSLLSLTRFPGLNTTARHTVAGQQQRQHKPSHPNPSHPHTSHPHSSHSSHHHNMSSQNKRHGPTELSLGSFMTTPTTGARPHTPMNRPQRNTNKTTAELRQAELEQLATRFQGNHHLVEKGRERSVYRLTFAPTDPDWSFSFKTIDLELTFPHDYPAQALAINLPTDQKLHSVYLNHGNLAVSRYLATAPGGSGELMLRPFLRWLDKTITNIFKDAAKQIVAADLFSDETTPPEDHTPYTSEEGEESEAEVDQSDDESDEEQLPLMMVTEKRGTEMRLSGLVMSDGVGVGRCASVKVTLQCTRCRAQQDETIRADSPASQSCSQCQHCFSFSYRPAVFHSASSTLGFLDLQGCLPVDLVLMQCDIALSCLECGRDNTTSGLNYGEHREMWCKRCHARLSLYLEQCRFIQHQPGSAVLPDTISSSKRERKKAREAVIQVGKPLPEFGTCVHFKKSNRWLRFPCCGKPFPCDECHDETQDHVMERANRMICGFCSREQTYSSTRPCVGCGGDLVGGRVGAYWEGGKGCRNKIKMSRNDLHKYSNSAQKTQCKKQERVGKTTTARR